ncbi:hypothetical protein ACFW4K_11945 [Nocardiopsis alba]|uniref:hypothetical protein n=1 Tax=Nocardiopsis alba TaxID=53437 RepID=UPI00366D96EF
MQKFIFTLVCSLALASCGTDLEESEIDSRPQVSKIRVTNTASAHTAERMFVEQNQDDLIGTLTERQEEDLLEGGVLIDEGDRYTFEPDPDLWTVAALLGEPGVPIARVHNAIHALLFANNVTWCGGEIRGTEFVYEYVDNFDGEFETYEEYEQSISDYVDCGTGE